MKTYTPTIKDIERKWYLVDAKDKVIGRLATKIADILRGKNKAYFAPHMDCGDYVIVINVKDIKFTGAKLEKKLYYHHTGYLGHLREIPAKKLMQEKPEALFKNVVAGMIPRNRLKRGILDKLKIFASDQHPHEAQKPVLLNLL